MKYINQVITILGISTLLSGIAAAVYAQAPLLPIEKSRAEKSNLQQFYNQGVQKLAQGNFNGAVEDFDKVLQLNPRYYEGYCLRGLAKAQLQDFQAALADYNQAIKLDSRHIDAYNGRGMTLAEQGNIKAAIADFNQTVKIDPKFVDGYYNLGLLSYRSPRSS